MTIPLDEINGGAEEWRQPGAEEISAAPSADGWVRADSPTHRETLLATALGDLLVSLGAATEGTPLTGPQLLLLAEDATKDAGWVRADDYEQTIRANERAAVLQQVRGALATIPGAVECIVDAAVEERLRADAEVKRVAARM